MNFLQNFCKLLEKTEVPPRFAIWCGVSALLAMMERRIWIEQGIYTIYPNFFIVLIAGSGQKKSTAINLAAKLLRKADPGPKIIAQMVTPEGLITSLKNTKEESSEVYKQSSGGIIIADELVTLIDRRTIERGLGKVLTTLYDCNDVFEYQTVARGIERLHGSYLSLLGGTTVELIKDSIPLQSVGGGLTSRIIFVYDDSVPEPVPWVDYDKALVQIEEDLIHYLQGLSSLNGPIRVTPSAREFYEHDYREFYNSSFRMNPYLRGYANRRHTHLFKLSIAVMLAEEPSLILTEHHLQGAKIILEEAEIHMESVMEMIVSTEMGSSTIHVMNFIKMQGAVTRKVLVRKYQHRFDAKEISGIIDTLSQSGRISIDTDNTGQMIYRTVGS